MHIHSPARNLALALISCVLCLACSNEFDVVQPGIHRHPIVSGRLATPSEIHSTVAFLDETLEPYCTGTLIAPQVVVTAAHCFVEADEETGEIRNVTEAKNILVAVNSLNAMNVEEKNIYDVMTVAVHERYPDENANADDDGLGAEYDIALVLLNDAVDGVSPTPVLPWSRVDEISRGTEIIISGYGLSNASDDASSGILRIAETPFQRRSALEYIAGAAGTPDTCQGDSGGPGYVNIDGTRYLVGASARGIESTDIACGRGGISTLLPAFDNWLVEHAEGFYDPEGPYYDEGGCQCVVGSPRPTELPLLGILALPWWRRRHRAAAG